MEYNYTSYTAKHKDPSPTRSHFLAKILLSLILISLVIIITGLTIQSFRKNKQHKLEVKESYNTMYQNKNYLELIEKMDGELKHNPLQVEFLIYRGFSYYLLGESEREQNKQSVYFSMALYDLRKAVVVCHSSDLLADVYFCIGKIYYYYGNGYYNQCIDYLNRSLACGNERIDLLYVLGLVYSYIGEYEKANQVLLRSLDIEVSGLALLSVGMNHYRMNQKDKAREYLMQTIEFSEDKKNQERAWQTLGMIALEEKDYRKALDCFNRVIGINENNAEAYFQRGEIYYLYFRDSVKARSEWRKTVEIDPSHIRANERL